jgi:peptide/nickel transport system permease protein
MAGAGTSVAVAVLTVVLAVLMGTFVGLLAGFLRGWTDRIAMAINDALLAFPGILLALAIMVVLGASKYGIVLALALAYAPSVVRIVRGTVLSVREREFIEASHAIGNSRAYTMLRHVLPNCTAPIVVLATSMVGWVLLTESALSFLGLGVPPPAPTWGNMLASARPYMESAAWLSIAPGVCIALVLLGVNLLGDALRDRLDPRTALQ